jgi:hypothetical protein
VILQSRIPLFTSTTVDFEPNQVVNEDCDDRNLSSLGSDTRLISQLLYYWQRPTKSCVQLGLGNFVAFQRPRGDPRDMQVGRYKRRALCGPRCSSRTYSYLNTRVNIKTRSIPIHHTPFHISTSDQWMHQAYVHGQTCWQDVCKYLRHTFPLSNPCPSRSVTSMDIYASGLSQLPLASAYYKSRITWTWLLRTCSQTQRLIFYWCYLDTFLE